MEALIILKSAVKSLMASQASNSYHEEEVKRAPINNFSLHRTLLIPIFILIIITYGCKKSPVEPKFDPELLVSKLNIALVISGSESVDVSALDNQRNIDDFTVSTMDAGIASVTTSGNTFTITGVDYGITEIIVTSASGKKVELTVIIYNPQVLETEELLITFSQAFESRWNSSGYFPPEGSFYHPLTSNGFKPLGSLGFEGIYDPNNTHGVMVLKAKDGSNALAQPVDYTLLWTDVGTIGANGTFWIPVPPAGYKAMGIVAQAGHTKPDLDDVVCVREDLTIPGESGILIWYFSKMLSDMDGFSSWLIEQPVAGPHEDAYLSTGTFVATGESYVLGPGSPPAVNTVMNVLNVNLPMLAETPYQDYAPTLNGYDPPPEETVPILAREMLVPCTILNDPLYDNNQMWRITNSPFYRLERHVFYKLIYHNHNQTSVMQHNSYTQTIGVTTTESDEFWTETSISITAEAGISIFGIGGKISTTVSRSFGYSTMTSVAELQQDEYESGVDVLPGKAVAIWQRYNRFVLKRHNGTALEPVKAWEFGINSFITDEYPD